MLITGGVGDIGTALTRRFLQMGHTVVVCDLLKEREALEHLREAGNARLLYRRLDYLDPASVACLAGEFNPDGLILNAGITQSSSLLDCPVEDWQQVLDINLTGSFRVTQAFARKMAARGSGWITFVGTWVKDHAWPNLGAYPVSKAGLKRLMANLALELCPSGVRVNMVSPGILDAGMSKRQMDREPFRRERAMARVPCGRLGTAGDVVDAVAFLASDQASYIYGTDILVDGGVSLSV